MTTGHNRDLTNTSSPLEKARLLKGLLLRETLLTRAAPGVHCWQMRRMELSTRS